MHEHVFVCVSVCGQRRNKHTRNVVFRLEPTTTKLTSAVDGINETLCLGGPNLGTIAIMAHSIAARNSEILKSRKSHEFKIECTLDYLLFTTDHVCVCVCVCEYPA